MNWAIGQGSIGGLLARRWRLCRVMTRTNSFLQSQKLDSNSRSSSGVRRSEEKVVRAGVSIVGSRTTVDRFFLADFMTILPRLGTSTQDDKPGEKIANSPAGERNGNLAASTSRKIVAHGGRFNTSLCR